MKELDVTTIAPKDRHPLIFKTFDELKKGGDFTLTNDHDPKPAPPEKPVSGPRSARAPECGWASPTRAPAGIRTT